MRKEFSNSAHETALKILAQETRTPRNEVTQVYENELSGLKAGARIQTFVPALALRRARDKLHRRRYRT